ncbi:uncharacterized protein LOC132288599 [Cornus florida]|uniref:uncharacterized protein LOC132288599 n=1 Tax=Cornus florida TaxID=4283 RepID=UPI00289FA5C6|nr:uncharacterized protein LOC132288599 [Cornus florida]
MYVTRPLSRYLKFPDSLSLPPEGPNSGYLVLQDEESETTTCFGLCKDSELQDLPFPQNKDLTVHYGSDDEDVAFIPVLNQPLSSNLYYAIKPHRKHKGEAYTCSAKKNETVGCFGISARDVKPRPLNPHDMYQQFEIFLYPQPQGCYGGGFYAKSVAPNGHPPNFLRRKGWKIYTKTPPKKYELGEAPGLNTALRARLPEFNFPLACEISEAVTIGKWYCPFMFIKEGTLKEQMKRSMFYEMTLEQTWEQIFECENNYREGNTVSVNVVVVKEVVLVAQREAVWDERKVVDGAIWFTGFGDVGEEIKLGLSLVIVERMKWEQERAGWIGGEERQVWVKRVEEFGGIGGWKRFGCYVLVEKFVLKRMDGSVVLTYSFNHTHQIKSKWE